MLNAFFHNFFFMDSLRLLQVCETLKNITGLQNFFEILPVCKLKRLRTTGLDTLEFGAGVCNHLNSLFLILTWQLLGLF